MEDSTKKTLFITFAIIIGIGFSLFISGLALLNNFVAIHPIVMYLTIGFFALIVGIGLKYLITLSGVLPKTQMTIMTIINTIFAIFAVVFAVISITLSELGGILTEVSNENLGAGEVSGLLAMFGTSLNPYCIPILAFIGLNIFMVTHCFMERKPAQLGKYSIPIIIYVVLIILAKMIVMSQLAPLR